MTRRQATRQLAGFLAASPLLAAPQEQLINVFDFDAAAKGKLPKAAYDYVSGGSWDEWTLRRNRTMFERIILQPRFFREVNKLDLSLTLFGQKMAMPILVAPTGTHALVHPDGELATVRGAGAAGAGMVVSTSSSFPIEKISAEAKTPLWFQLYTGPDAEGTRERVSRAVTAGCKAICVTVDAPYQAPRERDTRNGLVRVFGEDKGGTRQRRYSEEAPGSPYGLPMRFQATLNWKFLDQLCAYAKVPVLVKGILTREDALLALQHGAAGMIVSNHGGRYLDGAPSTIEVLPGIVDAVKDRAPVLIDSGFRRGTDILKALAIGAKAVLVGRPPLWGLGAQGQDGVQRVLEILRTELAWAMGLAGRATLASVDRSLIRIE
ncbi:MAG: alpha-hydroxy-acid oxidizing protein [Acidobacteriia bacterium]|nr:alpha-hydroxy-acid oxidizing protein [Terriglobia bacterium]